MLDLDPVQRITVGAVGEPGARTFFLQARDAERLVTLVVEKEQVELLSASVVEILARVGQEVEEGPMSAELDLEEPIEPEWRVGRLSLGYEADRDLMLLEAAELLDDDEDEVDEREPDTVRLYASRDQMLALARHGVAVAAAGRPRCQLCGNPLDPDGHLCPALNGHRGLTDA